MDISKDNIDQVWEQVATRLKSEYPKDALSFDSIFAHVSPVYNNDGAVTLVADTLSFKKWIELNYLASISDVFCSVCNDYVKVRVSSIPSCETIPIDRGLEFAFSEIVVRTQPSPKTQTVGISTSLKDLDESTGGLRNGQLAVLSGRAYTQEFAINLAITAAKNGVRVYYFSMSRSLPIIAQSFLYLEAGIASYRMASGHLREVDWQYLADTTGYLSKLDINFIDSPCVTCEEIENTVALARKGKKDVLVVVDQIDQMDAPDELRQKDRKQQIAGIVQGLQKAAVSMDVPVLALSSIARAHQYESQRPRIEDMEYADPIRLYADVVMLLDMCLGSIEEEMDSRPAIDEAWVYLDKNRNQAHGWIGHRLGFDRAIGTFYDYVSRDKSANPREEEQWEDISYEELKKMFKEENSTSKKNK